MTTHTQDYHWDPLLLLVATDKVSSCFLCPNRFHIWCQMWMPMKGSPILVFLICDLNGLLHFGQQISSPEQEQIQRNGRDGDNLKQVILQLTTVPTTWSQLTLVWPPFWFDSHKLKFTKNRQFQTVCSKQNCKTKLFYVIYFIWNLLSQIPGIVRSVFQHLISFLGNGANN